MSIISWKNILFKSNVENEHITLVNKSCHKEKLSFDECRKCANFLNCFDAHCHLDGDYVVDFVITYENKSINIMVDDFYWHAKDKSIKELVNSNKQEDKIRYAILTNDLLYNDLCVKNNANLIRIIKSDMSEFLSFERLYVKPYFTCGDKRLIKRFMKKFNSRTSANEAFSK